jgi:hypothetical protein
VFRSGVSAVPKGRFSTDAIGLYPITTSLRARLQMMLILNVGLHICGFVRRNAIKGVGVGALP